MLYDNEKLIKESNELVDKIILWKILVNSDYKSYNYLNRYYKNFMNIQYGIKNIDANNQIIWNVLYNSEIKNINTLINFYITNQDKNTDYFIKRFVFTSKKVLVDRDFDKINIEDCNVDINENELYEVNDNDDEYIKNIKLLFQNVFDEIKTINEQRSENGLMKKRIIYLLEQNIHNILSPDQLKNVGFGINNSKKIDLSNVYNGVYYIKKFSKIIIDNDNIYKIDPREPFIYKVLEYMQLGPKTYFLIGKGSSSITMNSLVDNNFIMTEEVSGLLLDGRVKGTMNNKPIALNQDKYELFKNNKNGLIEFSIACIVKGLLSINDVFPDNTENYGIVQIDKNNNFKFMIIDHLPGGNGPINSLCSEEDFKTYSPRSSIEQLCKSKKELYKGNLNNIKSSTQEKFTDKVLSKDVNKILFNTKDNRLSIYEAIEKALNDVKILIKHNASCFFSNSTKLLNDYKNLINYNMDKYKETTYYDIYVKER